MFWSRPSPSTEQNTDASFLNVRHKKSVGNGKVRQSEGSLGAQLKAELAEQQAVHPEVKIEPIVPIHLKDVNLATLDESVAKKVQN